MALLYKTTASGVDIILNAEAIDYVEKSGSDYLVTFRNSATKTLTQIEWKELINGTNLAKYGLFGESDLKYDNHTLTTRRDFPSES